MTDSKAVSGMTSPAAAAFAGIIQSAQIRADALAGRLAAACFQGASEGHSCLDVASYFTSTKAVSDTSADLAALFEGNRLVMTAFSPRQAIGPCLLVIFKGLLYLKKSWLMETALIEHVLRRSNTLTIPDNIDVSRRLALCCLDKPLSLLTGGPGTGKTTAISGALVHWITAFHDRHGRIPHILLCAPTGKAAARMNEAWQRQKPLLLQTLRQDLLTALPEAAQTLHRLLAIHPISRRGRYHPDRPLKADLLVLDEASMIDLPMILQLFDALPASCHLLLVGDPDQLPSIEIGSVLRALISLPEDGQLRSRLDSAHVRLRHNYRQAESPGLTTLSQDVMQAAPELVQSRMTVNAYADVGFQDNDRHALATLIESAVRHYQTLATQACVEQALSMLEQRIILCPVRDGPSGCETLNARIGNALRAHAGEHGHVLMVTENMPSMGLSNGDIGIVWRHSAGLQAHFQSGGHLFSVALTALPQHEAAYALTVHKAQGSEFEHVDLVLPESDSPLLDKSLFYTAITRARKSLCLTASPGILSAMLHRDSRRMSGLAALAGSTEQEVQ